jgi:hypothetical protein
LHHGDDRQREHDAPCAGHADTDDHERRHTQYDAVDVNTSDLKPAGGKHGLGRSAGEQLTTIVAVSRILAVPSIA